MKKELFHNDSVVLRIHNEETVKKWVLDFLESLDEEVFLGGLLQNAEGVKQYQVLDAWINLSTVQWKKSLGSLSVYSEENYESTKPTNVFSDSEKTCYNRFANGLVKITANDIEAIQKDALKDRGEIWESEQHFNNIELESKKPLDLFETFVINALEKHDHSLNNKDCTQN